MGYAPATTSPSIRVLRRGGRVVDRVALEMRSTRKRTGGSNPSLSAIFPHFDQMHHMASDGTPL